MLYVFCAKLPLLDAMSIGGSRITFSQTMAAVRCGTMSITGDDSPEQRAVISAAGWIPARQASRVPAIVVLRDE